jgi:hypothetical protein
MTAQELADQKLADQHLTDKELADHELLDQFERATLPLECFHHAEHVRVAFLYLRERPVLEALQAFSTALQRFAAANGKSKLYHETITGPFSDSGAAGAGGENPELGRICQRQHRLC